jgi:hypothetical protein
MAIIPQITLFSWENDIENMGDLARLTLVLENMPDESFIRKLENERGRGRNDYPIRPMWNMIIAMIVFGHARYADVIREMKRNAQLRYACGFGWFGKIPDADNVSRFVSKIEDHQEDLLMIFVALSDMLYDILPDFGKNLALDSKWVWSLANRKSDRKSPDGRSETDAEWGKKEYSGVHADGTPWSSVKKCFGFKFHVLVDSKYELPVAFITTPANGSDIVCGKELLETLAEERPHIFDRCVYFTADKAYDDTDLILWLKDKFVKAVIDKRSLWRTEEEKMIEGDPRRYYDEDGNVYCYSPETGERHKMIPAGYDKERDALRFKCPVSHYGATCSESDACGLCRHIRVPLSTDERIFTQVNRVSYKWNTIYAGRTAVERVNSRLDVSVGFETRRTRGLGKMNMLGVLAFVVMNGIAVGRIMQGRPELMRSLIRAA